MIVILCNSFQEVQDGFDVFMDFLDTYEPFSILHVYPHSYCVETDDNLRYIFIDYRMKSLASTFDDVIDYIDLEAFFESIDDFYTYFGT